MLESIELAKYSMLVMIILVILMVGCEIPQEKLQSQEKAQNPLDKLISEEINYTQYTENGFSVLYPQWPDTTKGDVELTVSKGYCTVAVNTEGIPAKQWFGMFLESIEKQSGEIIISDEDNLQAKFSLNFQNVTLISDNRIFVCNDESTTVTITCVEEVDKVMQKLSDTIYSSVSCQEEEMEFKEYQEDDFSVSYPDWEEINDGNEQRVLGRTKGVCSVIVDKHNALPEDIFHWLTTSIEEKENHTMLDSSIDAYTIEYQFSYGENAMTANTKVLYCNYQSYITQVLCVDEYVTEEDREIKDTILHSVQCAQEYEIPTPEIIEEEKEEVKERTPEIIEELEDEIVKTNIGEEFGIDEEMVVYFINSNDFFTRIMKDFPRANLVVEDDDRELRLRVLVDSDGKIALLEDGSYDDADVTLIVPLRDALNVFSNAKNINPLTLIGFAVNVRTEPAAIKNEVIQKVLRGEYS